MQNSQKNLSHILSNICHIKTGHITNWICSKQMYTEVSLYLYILILIAYLMQIFSHKKSLIFKVLWNK